MPLNQPLRKRYYYKIFDTNLNYLTTWSTDVVSEPQFRMVLNGGAGEIVVRLARKYNNFGEGSDVAFRNRVELWVADNDNLANNAAPATLWDTAVWDSDQWDQKTTSFMKLLTGYISMYTPTLDGDSQYVDVTILGYTTEMTYRYIKDGSGNTTFTYTNQEIGTIVTDLITKYRADGGININYSGGTIGNTGINVTYTFQCVTLKDALDKCVQLAPDNWYWYMDANGVVYFRQTSTAVDHTLTIGKDVSSFQVQKRVESLTNQVLVIGGGNPNLYNIYARSASQNTYGKWEMLLKDMHVTDNATADYLAKRQLDYYQNPETRVVVRVADNNGENTNQGQNIEAFYVGDTIQIKNYAYDSANVSMWDVAKWDTNVWDSTINYSAADILVIQSINYTPHYIEIEASSRLPEINKSVTDIVRTYDNVIKQNLPASPTNRSV